MKVIQYIRVNHYFRNVAFVSSVLLFILVTLLCLPISSDEQDTIAVTNQGDSITINFTNNTASVDLSVNNADGTFATSSTEDKAAFSISTDNASGYTLSISSNDDTGELTSGTSSLTSIDSAISSTTFDNSSYNGKWGYLPSKYNSTDNTNYLPSPTTDISILDITSSANATANNYTIALGARTDYSNAVGNYSKTFTLTSIANIIPESCNNSKLCIEYDANGLYYVNPNTTMNRVNYNSTTSQEEVTKYSHTPNLTDAGERDTSYNGGNGAGNYANSYTMNEVVTIPGASTLHVKLTYGGESASYDWVSFWEGNYPSYTAASNYSTGVQNCGGGTVTNGKYGGTTGTTVECDITSDTVTFAFKSDSGGYGNGYGYYAVVTSPTVYERSVYSGSYIAPNTSSAQTFRGWSTTQVAGGTGHESDVEYLDEAAVMASIPGSVGETKTLYAVWQQTYPVTITKDENVSSVTILDSSGNTVSTITDSSQTVSLSSGDTYTINPTYNTRYAPNTFEKTSGEGTFTMNSGYEGTLAVGAGPATISITSQYVDTPMQNYNCANLSNVGDTKYLYDTRDNEVYLAGKLADNKCWMLDNLRFDIVAHKDDISSANTNITNSATLTSLKIGNRSAGDNYATAGVSYWTSSYSYSAPLIAIKNASNDNWNPNTTTTSYGSGSGKIGVYYNFCAASAGSYCYGNGTSSGSSSGNATEDICPAGWRMSTGGSSGEYQALYAEYSGASEGQAVAFRNALSSPLSGNFNNGSAQVQGTYGYFWSSTWIGGNMNYLYVGSSNVNPSGDIRRYYGNSVRCLLMSTNTYTLNYDKNTTDTVSNMPSSQSATIQNDKLANFTIPTDNIPSRSGYSFAGWGTSSDQEEPTYKYNNSTFTPSEATVYANDNPKTLYAIWQAPREITFNIDSNVSSVQILDPSGDVVSIVTTTGTNVNLTEPLTYTIKPTHAAGIITNTITKTSGAGTLNGEKFTVGAGAATIDITSKVLRPMQNWTGCSSLAVGDTEQVYDTRDNQIYLVGKLKDNKCWMLENLNLAGGTALSASDTNVDSSYISSFTTSNNLTKTGDTIVLPASSTSGFGKYNYSYVYNSGNKTNCGASGQNTPCYSYYSWDAATLGSGRTIGTDNTDAPYSICPKGWRLPTAYTTDASNWQTADFYTLAHLYGLDSTTSTMEEDSDFYTQAGPGTLPDFLLAGLYSLSSLYYGGSYGFYWSATSYSSTDFAHALAIHSMRDVYSVNNSFRSYGQSVRCLSAE